MCVFELRWPFLTVFTLQFLFCWLVLSFPQGRFLLCCLHTVVIPGLVNHKPQIL